MTSFNQKYLCLQMCIMWLFFFATELCETQIVVLNIPKQHLLKVHNETEETVQSVKCLSCKHEDLGSRPTTHKGVIMILYVLHPSQLDWSRTGPTSSSLA